MIGKLKGILDAIGEDHIIIDVHGVGYQVYCSSRVLDGLPLAGEMVSMAIETHVRENEIKLFGFSDDLERDWFRLLQSVQGVGTKVALAIQSTINTDDLANAIMLQDKEMLARAPGVGPRVAQRIAGELKDKTPTSSSSEAVEKVLIGNAGEDITSPVGDAISALGNLGYSSQQAAQAISIVLKSADENSDSATLIRLGLKQLSK